MEEADAKETLFQAAKNDDAPVILYLHNKGLINLDVTDNNGKTAVFYANENKCTYALCELIDCYANFNLNDIDDDCAKDVLFKAVEMDSDIAILRLDMEGLDLNATDDEGNTAVFYANKNKSIDALCALIHGDANFNLNDIDDDCAKGVLFKAVEMDSDTAILRLDMEGLDLNLTDDEGNTAVFYANKYKSIKALFALIDCYANFNLNDIDDDCAKDVLFKAVEMDSDIVILRLDMEGLDLNATDDEGNTAVFYANKIKCAYALCALIDCDANFNLNDIDDDCAKDVLFRAARMDGETAILRLSLEGFDLNATDVMGNTAVFYANKKKSSYALCELIASGAKFKLDEIDGKALLFFASRNDMSNIIKPLYNAGVDLQQTDDEGKTVVFHGDEHFLDCLTALDENILINARDLFGRTPLFYAARDGELMKARCLIEKGGNLQLKDNCNVNIFSFCIQWYIAQNSILLLPSLPLFDEQHRMKELIIAIIDCVYCQSPLLSAVIPLPHLVGNLTKEGILKALALGLDSCLIYDVGKVDNIKKVISIVKEVRVDVPLVMSLLNKLGAGPNTADTDGNTALHYATLLPFFGVTSEVVINICKILQKFGSSFNMKNHQHESPLQLCLSSKLWKAAFEDNHWQPSIMGLVDICKFLLRNECGITHQYQNTESIFHSIISLIQQSLELIEDTPRIGATQVLTDILILLSSDEPAVRTVVNKTDALLNSPLHLWASIALKSSQSYASLITEKHTFESILRIIFDRFLKCGAKLNLRNGNDETP